MDPRLLDALRMAPTLELYKLRLAINQMLDDPRRIHEIRQHLHPGAEVTYHDGQSGTLATGRIVELRSTAAIVQNAITLELWRVTYVAIIASPSRHAEQAPQAPPQRPDMSAFKLGDTVSFTDKYLRERIGTITRLNPKTCTVMCDGEQWRVSPGLLRKIIDF